jgi:hypothetical protein
MILYAAQELKSATVRVVALGLHRERKPMPRIRSALLDQRTLDQEQT